MPEEGSLWPLSRRSVFCVFLVRCVTQHEHLRSAHHLYSHTKPFWTWLISGPSSFLRHLATSQDNCSTAMFIRDLVPGGISRWSIRLLLCSTSYTKHTSTRRQDPTMVHCWTSDLRPRRGTVVVEVNQVSREHTWILPSSPSGILLLYPSASSPSPTSDKT